MDKILQLCSLLLLPIYSEFMGVGSIVLGFFGGEMGELKSVLIQSFGSQSKVSHFHLAQEKYLYLSVLPAGEFLERCSCSSGKDKDSVGGSSMIACCFSR